MKRISIMKRIMLISIVCLMFSSICFGLPGVRTWKLTWDANSESDLAGYKVYYGSVSGTYTSFIDVGNKIEMIATGTIPNKSYIALTAYDLSGNESGYSAPIFFDKDSTAPAVVGGAKLVAQ